MKLLAGLAIALIVAVAAVDRAGRPVSAEVETEQADDPLNECGTDGDGESDGDEWASEACVEALSMRLQVWPQSEAGVPARCHWEEIGFPPWRVEHSRRS